MKLVFNIEYFTEYGQILYVSGNIPQLGSWNEARAAAMTYTDHGKWVLEIFTGDMEIGKLEYRYFLKDTRNDQITQEWGRNRGFELSNREYFSFEFMDSWRPDIDPENPLYTSAFIGNLWRRKHQAPQRSMGTVNHVFQLFAPRIDRDYVFCVCGSDVGLGSWKSDQAVIMDDREYPIWKAEVSLEIDSKPVDYKYGIYSLKKKRFVGFETGTNRTLIPDMSIIDNGLVIKTDIHYNYPGGLWKGAGVAIPVFSLRTKNSWGVGEFMDLRTLADWAVKTGLKMVQILPVNDTIANHTWKDSYPYAAISVFALHPVYLNLPEMGTLSDRKLMDSFQKKGEKLNKLGTLDYESVMGLKSRYFKQLYDQDRAKFLKNKEYMAFFNENKDWLVPYAAFSCLRDRYKTPDFTKWPEYSTFDPHEIQQLVSPSNSDYDDFAIHYFIQFHLHKQLGKAVEYARSRGVILKGDLPIGIHRDSVDAWVEPRLYHMDKQAGAPPDAYSVTGQNWRFPTYNWEEMAKDGYAWWRRRLSQMAKYFDAYRIDHILGFFRIWEIPYDSIEGLMGIFNPAIPLQKEEIESRGIYFDHERFCKPSIKEYMLEELFGHLKDEVKKEFLLDMGNGDYRPKESFDTQRKVEEHFWNHPMKDQVKASKLKFGLYTLLGNLLFFEEPGSNGTAFHPKIAFHSTYTYNELDEHTKNGLNDMYTHYFYHRQEAFWRDQAMVKLPAILEASNMLVCGEDLGMVPDCVPGVMLELGILRLYIQRMPKESDNEFGHPARAPYLSVASPSCHDMSTVRGWWEEDLERTQRFYNKIMGYDGEAPESCETWISEEILLQHLYSSAMWAIFPIQDLLGIDEKLMYKNAEEERINDPGNPDNLWRYRLHVNLEDLVNAKEFNMRIRKMVEDAGRSNGF